MEIYEKSKRKMGRKRFVSMAKPKSNKLWKYNEGTRREEGKSFEKRTDLRRYIIIEM